LKTDDRILTILVQRFPTQFAIKRLFEFLPYSTYASALPGEIKTHAIAIKMNKNAKNHP